MNAAPQEGGGGGTDYTWYYVGIAVLAMVVISLLAYHLTRNKNKPGNP